MKTVLLYACALFLLSCQKEVLMPKVQEKPQQVATPEPEPEPQPEPEPEPEPEPVSESVYLRHLPAIFNSENRYKLAKVYSDSNDLWSNTPAWAKDDIHTFNDYGVGTIESTVESCPNKPFSTLPQNWTAYSDEEGVKLTWVDVDYNPATFMMISAIAGKSFKASRVVEGVKVYYEFELTGK